jgi:hypothetical protein
LLKREVNHGSGLQNAARVPARPQIGVG